jgi:4-amino-4-deoxy-L-arabinose transferase-like glycosyltransferase
VWVAATVDANNAAGYQLSTNQPVMAIGGFNGTDPAPSLSQFQTYVREGKIHYFIAGGRGPGGGSTGSTAGQITDWVQANFSSRSVDGVTVYDLTTRNIGVS